MRFIRAERVKEKTVGRDLAVYVGDHRSIHVLNPSARVIWEALTEPLTADELHFILTEAFPDTAADVLRDDLQSGLDEFKRLHLVRAVPQPD